MPFMVKAVRSLGGKFTRCQSSWLDDDGNAHVYDLEHTESAPSCDQDLTSAVAEMQGECKIVFSSYFRRPVQAEDERACYFVPVYDFTPEHMGDYNGQPGEFYMKNDSIAFANGYLSNSDSTTSDLLNMHPSVEEQYVVTSPMRVSPYFARGADAATLDTSELNESDRDLLNMRLGSDKPFILLLGYTAASPKYKGYGLFWAAIEQMPMHFKDRFSILIIGGMPPIDELNMDVTAVEWVPEDILPHLYAKVSVLVYPSHYEGFGMPPLEAAACGCPLILGPFHKQRMQHIYGDDALYVIDVADMIAALTKVLEGKGARAEALIEKARLLGGDRQHGWNAVASDYLLHMLQGPFRPVPGTHCRAFPGTHIQSEITAATGSSLGQDWKHGMDLQQRLENTRAQIRHPDSLLVAMMHTRTETGLVVVTRGLVLAVLYSFTHIYTR